MLNHASPDTGLARSVRAAVERIDPMAAVASHGTFGPWRVVETVGSGGMGTVYKVVRADGTFDKLAALKLLHLNSAETQQRFRMERQILARLEHPNIGRLLDGGETESGHPFLVMEFVEGVPLPDYAESRNLGKTERLRLFLRICDAVQYLHQNLVIHRDLKPGDILVTPDGTPKLLDFGIAKLLDGGVMRTQTGAFALTPQYASPEQVRGLPVTTATDVYSLGVILYELLSGKRPYDVASLALVELDRVICESEPAKPNLGGDLDNVLMMALRKEAARRYASVEQFSRDIRHILADEPVSARPDTVLYRTNKFVWRNRLALAAAAVVVASLSAGIVVSRREAALAKRRFEQSRQYANAILNDFYPRIQSLVGATAARQALVEATNRHLLELAKDSAGDPELEFDLANGFRLLGSTYAGGDVAGTGDLQQAKQNLHRALQLAASAEKGGVPRRRVLAVTGFAHIDLGDAYAKTGEDGLARKHLRQAIVEGSELNDTATVTSARNREGDLLLKDGQLPEALSLFRQSEAAAPARVRSVTTWHRIVHVLRDQGNHSGALDLARQCVAEGQAHLARRPDSFQRLHALVVSQAQYTTLLAETPAPRAAIPAARELAVLLNRLAEGERHGPMWPDVTGFFGEWFYLHFQRLPRTELEQFASLFDRASQSLGGQHPNAYQALHTRLDGGHARVLAALGRGSEAAPLLRRAVDTARTLAQGPGSHLDDRIWLAMLLSNGEGIKILETEASRRPGFVRLRSLAAALTPVPGGPVPSALGRDPAVPSGSTRTPR